MTKFRIVRRGEKYRIQSRSWKTIWIWTYYKYVDSHDSEIIEFNSLLEAKMKISDIRKALDIPPPSKIIYEE